MNKDEALRLALEALEMFCEHGAILRPIETRDAIKAALEAKDEPEYYGLTKDHLWMSISKEHYDRLKPEFRMACYTTPPQRKPLTEIALLGAYEEEQQGRWGDHVRGLRAVEAAHGIKGEA